MPTDVVLGEGRMGEALLQAYPGQYRDAASESNAFDASSINIGQPGAYAGRPMAVGDPDLPANEMEERLIPGVGVVVVPKPSFGTVIQIPTAKQPKKGKKEDGLIRLYKDTRPDVQIPFPPALRPAPPVMRYMPQGVDRKSVV